MSNRLFQGVIHQMRDAIDRTVGVIDESGTVISCSELERIGEQNKTLITDIFNSNDPIILDGTTYLSFDSRLRHEYAIFVDGEDELAEKYARILSVSFGSIKQFYDEKYDRSNFVKNVILDNILPGDIYIKARELRFNSDATRVVLLIRITGSEDATVFDVIQNLFPDRNKDFVINISETDIALVKEVNPDVDPKDLENLAHSIADALSVPRSGSAPLSSG